MNLRYVPGERSLTGLTTKGSLLRGGSAMTFGGLRSLEGYERFIWRNFGPRVPDKSSPMNFLFVGVGDSGRLATVVDFFDGFKAKRCRIRKA